MTTAGHCRSSRPTSIPRVATAAWPSGGALLGIRSTDGQSWSVLATIGSVSTYIDGTVSPGGTYSYRVAAINTVGEGPASAAVTGQRAFPPGTPRAVSADAGKSQVRLTWTAPPDGGSPITAYGIYRSTSAGKESLYLAVAPGTTSFTDTNVTRKIRYYYRVSAVNNIGESPLSSEVTAAPR